MVYLSAVIITMDTHTHKKNHNNNKTVQDGNKDWMNSAKRHAKHRGNMLLTTGKQMYQRDMSFSDDLRTIQSLYRTTYQYIYIYIYFTALPLKCFHSKK